ncbi:MAG: hypothetical protein Q3962_03240 [Corynebacterium sp.]|nr:hypothetical protein [Corynebacterium sp.]
MTGYSRKAIAALPASALAFTHITTLSPSAHAAVATEGVYKRYVDIRSRGSFYVVPVGKTTDSTSNAEKITADYTYRVGATQQNYPPLPLPGDQVTISFTLSGGRLAANKTVSLKNLTIAGWDLFINDGTGEKAATGDTDVTPPNGSITLRYTHTVTMDDMDNLTFVADKNSTLTVDNVAYSLSTLSRTTADTVLPYAAYQVFMLNNDTDKSTYRAKFWPSNESEPDDNSYAPLKCEPKICVAEIAGYPSINAKIEYKDLQGNWQLLATKTGYTTNSGSPIGSYGLNSTADLRKDFLDYQTVFKDSIDNANTAFNVAVVSNAFRVDKYIADLAKDKYSTWNATMKKYGLAEKDISWGSARKEGESAKSYMSRLVNTYLYSAINLSQQWLDSLSEDSVAQYILSNQHTQYSSTYSGLTGYGQFNPINTKFAQSLISQTTMANLDSQFATVSQLMRLSNELASILDSKKSELTYLVPYGLYELMSPEAWKAEQTLREPDSLDSLQNAISTAKNANYYIPEVDQLVALNLSQDQFAAYARALNTVKKKSPDLSSQQTLDNAKAIGALQPRIEALVGLYERDGTTAGLCTSYLCKKEIAKFSRTDIADPATLRTAINEALVKYANYSGFVPEIPADPADPDFDKNIKIENKDESNGQGTNKDQQPYVPNKPAQTLLVRFLLVLFSPFLAIWALLGMIFTLSS